MSKENAKIKSLRNGLTIFEVIIVVLIIFTILWLFLPRIPDERQPAKRIICLHNMKLIGIALMMYAQDNSNNYPNPENWRDLIKPYLEKESDDIFRCPARKTGECHYAMNPDCEPNSSPDTVLLFEIKGGWNLSGGQELLSTENHGVAGSNILFNDGHVDFIEKDFFKNLKWSIEKDGND